MRPDFVEIGLDYHEGDDAPLDSIRGGVDRRTYPRRPTTGALRGSADDSPTLVWRLDGLNPRQLYLELISPGVPSRRASLEFAASILPSIGWRRSGDQAHLAIITSDDLLHSIQVGLAESDICTAASHSGSPDISSKLPYSLTSASLESRLRDTGDPVALQYVNAYLAIGTTQGRILLVDVESIGEKVTELRPPNLGLSKVWLSDAGDTLTTQLLSFPDHGISTYFSQVFGGVFSQSFSQPAISSLMSFPRPEGEFLLAINERAHLR